MSAFRCCRSFASAFAGRLIALHAHGRLADCALHSPSRCGSLGEIDKPRLENAGSLPLQRAMRASNMERVHPGSSLKAWEGLCPGRPAAGDEALGRSR